MSGWTIDIDRQDISRATVRELGLPQLEPGQIKVSIDSVGMTANNVTYAMLGDYAEEFGDGLGYFDYFGDRNQVSGGRIGRVASGARRMQATSPFNPVTVNMLPSEGASLYTDARPSNARVFPGNVAVFEADFVSVTAVFGRLVDEAGAPLSNMWLEGGHGFGMTDANGWFQLDVAGRERINAHNANHLCTAEMARDLVSDDGVAAIGDVVCVR